MQGEYDLAFFHSNGFQRRRCPTCGRYFWTQGETQRCGESPCVEYAFIGDPPMRGPKELSAMREAFLSFFEARGHPRVGRYPVVARWRNDVFFTQASIYPFQPYVIEGAVKPPANPLAISQPCVRFNDLDNVGRTGRHFSMFEMMAHHAFNFPGRQVYFKDRTTELCHQFLSEALGVRPQEVGYVEAWWEGGGNAGPCFEVTLRGLEIVTLVFMMYRGEGKDIRPMDTQVVDTGYGLERLTWVSQGSPSAYEAVFGPLLEGLRREAGVSLNPTILGEYSRIAGAMDVESRSDVRLLRQRAAERAGITAEELEAHVRPLENLYTICDHTRALVFLLNDGVVPSNAREGYFARLLVRRALRALSRLDLAQSLGDVVGLQIDHFGTDFPELEANRRMILKLMEVEVERYRETLSKGRAIVAELEGRLAASQRRIGVEELVELYDSHGLTPEVVQEFVGGGVEVPDDFFSLVARRHLTDAAVREEVRTPPPGIPPTPLLFYGKPRTFEFTAKVVEVVGGDVVLDKTYFYPEGGGQEADGGTIGGRRVLDVQLVGGVVLHRVDEPSGLGKGKRVRCQVDAERRMNLMRHHTATHIVNGAARHLLGTHVWQTGAHKAEDKATLDITHYQSLGEAEVRGIEALANEVVLRDAEVRKMVMGRDEAEAKYGFSLYQGGVVPGKEIRVVEIEDFDVEACGGTHADHTGEVGPIRILRTKRIQDGVVRLEYVAGKAALEHLRREGEVLRRLAEALGVPMEDLPTAVGEMVEENRRLRRELEKRRAMEVTAGGEDLLSRAEEVGGIRLVATLVDGSMQDLLTLSRELTSRPGVVFVGVARGDRVNLLVTTGEGVVLDASEIARAMAAVVGGKAGGRPTVAQGAGPDLSAAAAALEAGKARARALLASSSPSANLETKG